MVDPPPHPVPAARPLIVPLRSDPPWLRSGLLAVTLASSGAFAVYFALLGRRAPAIWLGLLPGLAIATFAGPALVFWGRKRGGTMQLEVFGARVVVREPSRLEEIVDLAHPCGVVLLADRASPRRVLLLSQHGEPVMVLDPRGGAVQGSSMQSRTVEVDLGSIALSPSSAHVLTLAERAPLEPLLETLGRDLEPGWPLVSQPLPSGEVLLVTRENVRIGPRVARVGDGPARRLEIQSAAGKTPALSLPTDGEPLLLALHEIVDGADGVDKPSDTPAAYVGPVVFQLLVALFGPEPPESVVASAGGQPMA